MLSLLSIVFGVLAGVSGIWAATTKVRNSQDDFIGDLQKQGRRASWAAVCAAISSALVALVIS